VERGLRDLTFNPDRQLDVTGPAGGLIEEKRRWLANPQPPGDGRQRHGALVRINAALQDHVADRRAELVSQRERIQEWLRQDRILGSREFAFCLFPEASLRRLLLDNA
jgi:hypothetical protein